MLPLHQAGIQNEGPRITRKQLIERIEPEAIAVISHPKAISIIRCFRMIRFPVFWMQTRETEFACS